MNLFNKVLLVKIFIRSINAEMVVQTEGWICDGTAFTELMCRRQCILWSNVWGTCTAFTSVSGKHLGWNCICRKYLD
jgi:hypothetical protein